MSCGRFVFRFCCILALLPATALAGGSCGADSVLVRASTDTVFVKHQNASMNCCLELRVEIQDGSGIIDFFEIDSGDPCRCTCCFDLDFSAGGFGEGRYAVRVWDAAGSILFGQAEVDVSGAGAGPVLLTARRGECRDPQSSDRATWGKLRALYR